jgi:hypothetical protein
LSYNSNSSCCIDEKKLSGGIIREALTSDAIGFLEFIFSF